MSWDDRQRIFTPGVRYLVVSNPAGGVEASAGGEVWVFVKLSYSRYDGLFVYQFRREPDGAGRSWALRDEAPEESWRDVFRPADG